MKKDSKASLQAGCWQGADTYSGISSKAVDLLAVLISQLEGGKLVLLLADRIGLDDCAEDREAILDIQGGIIAVAVYPCTH